MSSQNAIFYPTKRSALYAGIMLAVYALMLYAGISVFHLEVDPAAWPDSRAYATHGLSDIVIAGTAQETGPPAPVAFFTTGFWLSSLLIALMALILPYLRPVRASLTTMLTASLIVAINFPAVEQSPGLPLQFQLIMVLSLFSLYILLSFIGEIRDRQKLTALFSQYVPPELVEQYNRDPGSITLDGEAREITVLFCDICNFTEISEHLDPQVLADWLNRYFSAVSRVNAEHRGTLDKYIGDSVMAFWGAPVPSNTHAADALTAAFAMLDEVDALSREFVKEGLPPISVGIGLSTGVCNVGNLGSEYRMAYTVVGDTVNTAQRLERETRRYQVPIIVSAATAAQTPDMLFRELDTVHIKGRSERVQMLQPLGPKHNASPQLLETVALHRRAMRCLVDKDWTTATGLFRELSEACGGDKVYSIYLQRLKEFRHSRHHH
ncbi:adenylate/guanylate cyclase domain-containing protein [Granulosicoccaceae sp. 1_MG-2023]|nr:adenylate/guanylate cyclase domain-containing protein [Granulosicoccaceae sp. 1_MG-2023]